MEEFKEKLKEKAKQKIIENFDIYWDTILKGIKHIACAIFIIKLFGYTIDYPLKLSERHNIKLEGQEYIELIKNYGILAVYIVIIGVLAMPAIKLANRLKNISKEGVAFNDELQNTGDSLIKTEVQGETVKDLINSNDDIVFNEKSEEDMYDKVLQEKNETYNLMKCRNIKNNMKPLTMLVTRELYNNNKENITKEFIVEYIRNIGNRKKKKLEEKNKNIAENIIVFLKRNDIIESDDIEDDKYYFTHFGNIFMNYFQSGII